MDTTGAILAGGKRIRTARTAIAMPRLASTVAMSATEEHPTATPSPRVIAGRYLLGARRGTSVDAALFEAYDPELQRPVVVKIMHPELSAKLELQAEFRGAMEAVASLHHPNIAVAHSWGQTEWNGHKVLYVVSEQLTGGSLRDMLDRGRLLTPSQALVVGLEACKALDVLHRRGIFHGDVRPSTLVFGDDRRLRLVDPGLSQVLSRAAGGPAHRPNDLAKYASPEQARGGELEAKSDVYAVCLTMLETMTGVVPFVGDSTVATLANRTDKLMPVSADLGPLASVLERAGRPEPGDRYTAAEFGRALVAAS
jgi:serine/threonine protein kinase